MKRILIFLSFVLFTTHGRSQNFVETPIKAINSEKRLSLNAISFPIGLNGEQYWQFRLGYPLSQKLSAEIGSIYDKTISSEQINSSLRFKWYFKEKLYLFAGLENEYETNILQTDSTLFEVI